MVRRSSPVPIGIPPVVPQVSLGSTPAPLGNRLPLPLTAENHVVSSNRSSYTSFQSIISNRCASSGHGGAYRTSWSADDFG